MSAIAGLYLPDSQEATCFTAWPTIAACSLGRLVGRLAGVRLPGDRLNLAGKILAAASIPAALAVFAWQLMPFVARRYRITNRRIVEQRGLKPTDVRSIGLDEFDEIRVDVLPGQEWLAAGDVVFARGQTELLRLAGVSRPETFKAACQKVRQATLAVGEVLKAQRVAAQPAANAN